MDWFAWPFTALWGFFRPNSKKRVISHRPKPKTSQKRKLPKTPFYAHIPTRSIGAYQKYMDRAFSLSPSLEFEEGDARFHILLSEAVSHHGLSALDLELMRLQYLLADPEERKKYQNRWAVKVVNRERNDFFPSPWAILSNIFKLKDSSFIVKTNYHTPSRSE